MPAKPGNFRSDQSYDYDEKKQERADQVGKIKLDVEVPQMPPPPEEEGEETADKRK
jgi:hypothetical protein